MAIRPRRDRWLGEKSQVFYFEK